jgi:hypothetical protein
LKLISSLKVPGTSNTHKYLIRLCQASLKPTCLPASAFFDSDDDDDDDDDNYDNNNPALQTKYYATKILQTEKDTKCRLCHQLEETVNHIISACPILAKEQYIKLNYTSIHVRK